MLHTDGTLMPEEREELERRRWFMNARGYRSCHIAACNCPYWHGGHAERRLDEIEDVLLDAGISLNGRTLLDAIKALIPLVRP